MYINLKSNSAKNLQRALLANALFSGFCGGLILLAESTVLGWLGIEGLGIWPIGALLLLFSAYLFWMIRQRRLPRILVSGIIGGDWVWVLGSAVLLVLNAGLFSTTGVVLILDVAVVVAIFAVLQQRSLKKVTTVS
jgi:hypothetical protein